MIKYLLCLCFITSSLFSLEKDKEVKDFIHGRIGFLKYILADMEINNVYDKYLECHLEGQLEAYESMETFILHE